MQRDDSGLNAMTNVLRREELERRDLVETGNGASSDAATSQEEPQKLQEASKDPSLDLQRESVAPVDTFMSDVWSPEL